MVSDTERPIRPQLTEREADLLIDVIDMYIEGVDEAQKATIQDNSLGNLETLLKVCGGYTETVTDLKNVRKQLVEERQ